MAAPLEKTKYPGIYKRGDRYVVTWRHRGRQHKQSFARLDEAREAKGKRQGSDRRAPSRVKFEDYFERWIKAYAGRTARGFSESTRAEYDRPIRAYALPEWRAWRLTEVEPGDIRGLFGQMARDGETRSQIKKLRVALSALFSTAVEDEVRASNPVSGVRIPNVASGEPEDERPKALTRKELRLLLAATPERWRLFVEFLTHTGLRISEAVGLTWEHVELGEHPHVRVREQVFRGKRRKLKSSAGRRDVPLSPGMAARLLAHRRDTYRGPDAPVFATGKGTPLSPDNLRNRVLAPAAISAGFAVEVEDEGSLTSGQTDGDEPRMRPTIGFHSLRHTCASLLFEQGRNVKQVAEWLGHADPSFTLRTYVHLMDAGVGSAAFLDDAVEGGNGVATRHPESGANRKAAAKAKSAA